MLDRSLRDRYSRQTMFPGVGEAGQAKLLRATAAIIGCGALGCNIANLLARAGVGKIRIVDRDFPEVHNLQRQVLFDENDVKNQVPKAVAAERRLRKVNSTIDIRGIVADANYTNIEKFCAGADVILDGLDNFETRLLMNDVALKHGIPFVYGTAVASRGMTMTVIPGKTACYRCIRPVLPNRATLPTCETAGVIASAPAIIGALQATEAIKIMVGSGEINRGLILVDVWRDAFENVKIERRADCPACHGKYEFLEDRFAVRTTSFCGQSRAVQVIDSSNQEVQLDKLATRLGKTARVRRDDYALRFTADGHEVVVFPDGRAIIRGTTDETLAREIYARYIGSK